MATGIYDRSTKIDAPPAEHVDLTGWLAAVKPVAATDKTSAAIQVTISLPLNKRTAGLLAFLGQPLQARLTFAQGRLPGFDDDEDEG